MTIIPFILNREPLGAEQSVKYTNSILAEQNPSRCAVIMPQRKTKVEKVWYSNYRTLNFQINLHFWAAFWGLPSFFTYFSGLHCFLLWSYLLWLKTRCIDPCEQLGLFFSIWAGNWTRWHLALSKYHIPLPYSTDFAASRNKTSILNELWIHCMFKLNFFPHFFSPCFAQSKFSERVTSIYINFECKLMWMKSNLQYSVFIAWNLGFGNFKSKFYSVQLRT